jgi:hypothetical protein
VPRCPKYFLRPRSAGSASSGSGRPVRQYRLRLGVSPQTLQTPPRGGRPVLRHQSTRHDNPRPPHLASQQRPARHYPRLRLRTPLGAGPTGLSPASSLRRPAHTTEPPPRPMSSADDVPALPPSWLHEVRATPDGSHVHHELDRRVRRPALPLRHRHGYAAGLHRGLPTGHHMAVKEFPTAGRQQVRAAPSPYPPDLSWWAVKGRQTLVPLVHLPVSLTGPAPSGSTDASQRCRGCSHPPRHLPDQAAPSFTWSLRQPGGEGFSPPLDFGRLVAHVIFGPVDAARHAQALIPFRRGAEVVFGPQPARGTRLPNGRAPRPDIPPAVRDPSPPPGPSVCAGACRLPCWSEVFPDSGSNHET